MVFGPVKIVTFSIAFKFQARPSTEIPPHTYKIIQLLRVQYSTVLKQFLLHSISTQQVQRYVTYTKWGEKKLDRGTTYIPGIVKPNRRKLATLPFFFFFGENFFQVNSSPTAYTCFILNATRYTIEIYRLQAQYYSNKPAARLFSFNCKYK